MRAFSYLRVNAAVIGNCEVYNVGLWDCDCTHTLNLGASTVLTSAVGKETGAKASVQCLDSAKFSSGIGTIDILKIDTEGAEVPILCGMRQLLADIKVVYLEFHSHMDRCVIDVLLSETVNAIAGRPLSIRLIDERQQERAERKTSGGRQRRVIHCAGTCDAS